MTLKTENNVPSIRNGSQGKIKWLDPCPKDVTKEQKLAISQWTGSPLDKLKKYYKIYHPWVSLGPSLHSLTLIKAYQHYDMFNEWNHAKIKAASLGYWKKQIEPKYSILGKKNREKGRPIGPKRKIIPRPIVPKSE